MRTDAASASHRAKQFVRMGKLPDEILGFLNLSPGIFRLGFFTKRRTVRQGVVGDPVAFRVSPDGQRPAAGFRQPFTNDKESRWNPPDGENVEDMFRDPRRRPIVESESHTFHVNRNFRLALKKRPVLYLGSFLSNPFSQGRGDGAGRPRRAAPRKLMNILFGQVVYIRL